MLSDPRRSGRVPSSTTVTPFEATRWPIRPENAEVFLRLKSPSSPCPTASCSMTAGRRRHRAEIDERLAQRFLDLRLPVLGVEISVVGDPPPGAVRPGFHALT